MTDAPRTQLTRLAGYTTLRLGGPARAVVTVSDARALRDTVTALDAAGEPVLIIGGGSNLVIADEGFDGTAVVLRGGAAPGDVTFGEVTGASEATGDITGASEATGDITVTAWAGTDWDSLVAATVDAGFGGLECLSGIPGAAGTTPVQNVGAYGVEVADVLTSVTLFDRATGDFREVAPADLGLAYRSSDLKHRSDRIVVSVTFRLSADGLSRPIAYRELAAALGVGEGDRAPVAQVRETVLALRAAKGMVLDAGDHDAWSAGSFFTNPLVPVAELPAVLARIEARLGDVRVPQFPAGEGTVKLSAGWLIERAGFHRGFPGDGAPARLSTKHTLALTNRGTATTADLLALARTVQGGVYDAFGVTLHPEPVFVRCAL